MYKIKCSGYKGKMYLFFDEKGFSFKKKKYCFFGEFLNIESFLVSDIKVKGKIESLDIERVIDDD